VKPRRVIVTLEVLTDAPLGDLRRVVSLRTAYGDYISGVQQVQVNVVRPAKPVRKRTRR
jgi:hypothetical protein